MKILSIECSAVPCSAAIIENEKVIASSFVNVKLTHSQTLMPMVEEMLKSAKVSLSEIDGFAVSYGPGSFTGIRIGISAVKGLALPLNKPCVGVSTLDTIAENYRFQNTVICACMDARCNQVYNALYKAKNGIITKLCDDRALMCDELANELCELYDDSNIVITGDGAEVFYPFVKHKNNIQLADIKNRFQNAVGVGLLALDSFKSGNTVSSKELLPVYLRLPQAERELKLKKEQTK